jgi:hypothetical protein
MPEGGALEDQTGAGIEAEGCGSGEIRLGIGLAAGDVAGGNHGGRDGESDSVEAGGGETASAGSDDGVAVGREGGEQGAGSGQDLEAGDVGDLGLLDEFGLVRGVEVRRDQADGLDGGAAVSDVDDVGGVEVVLVGPGRPDASAAGSGVNEDSVEIEEDGVDVVSGHVDSFAEANNRRQNTLRTLFVIP